jgi:integrase
MVLESIKYIKHKVIVLLMLDAGLRISEACSIKCKILILKSKYYNSISKKRRKTLANNSNIKPALSSNREY